MKSNEISTKITDLSYQLAEIQAEQARRGAECELIIEHVMAALDESLAEDGADAKDGGNPEPPKHSARA